MHYVLQKHPRIGWLLKFTYDWSANEQRALWLWTEGSSTGWTRCEPEEFKEIVAARLARWRLDI